jgi:hypothetical protein
MSADIDPSEQVLFGAAEDADPACGAVAREEQVVVLVDENAGNSGRSWSERRYCCRVQSSTSTRSPPVCATYIRCPDR